MMIVNSVLMLLNLPVLQSNVRACRARPVPSVVVVNPISDFIIRLMSVSTENVVHAEVRRELECSVCNLSIEALPVRVELVQHPREPFFQEVHALHPEVDRCEDTPEERHAMRPEFVILVTVDRHALPATPSPLVLFINFHAEEVFHNVSDPGVVVAFNPYDFHAALRIGEFTDVANELPLLARNPRKIKVLENVAEKDQTFEAGMS